MHLTNHRTHAHKTLVPIQLEEFRVNNGVHGCACRTVADTRVDSSRPLWRTKPRELDAFVKVENIPPHHMPKIQRENDRLPFLFI